MCEICSKLTIKKQNEVNDVVLVSFFVNLVAYFIEIGGMREMWGSLEDGKIKTHCILCNNSNDLFRFLSNICDGAFLGKL